MKIDKQKLYELKHQRAEALDAADQALEGGDTSAYEAALEKVKGYNTQIQQVEQLLTSGKMSRQQFQQLQQQAKQLMQFFGLNRL